MKEKDVLTKEEKPKAILHFRPLFFFFLLLLAGVIFVRRAFVGDVLYIILTATIFLFVLLYSIHRRSAFVFVFCAFAFALGGGIYCLSTISYNNEPNFDTSVSIVGRIKDDISFYGDNNVSLTLEDVKIDGKTSSNIRLTIYGSEKDLQAGCTLAFEGTPTKEPLFSLGSFRNNYTRKNVVYYCSANYEDLTILEGQLKFDEKIRKSIKDTLLSSMSEENAYIAYAVLTGEKSGIEDEIYHNYKASGIVHILTVSGLHIGVFSFCIAFILKKLKAKGWLNLIITATILLFYCYVCGFSPSVVRASIMSLVLIFSWVSGKQYDTLSSISLAGIILLFINPLYGFDVGFLMSFFCVIFIALVQRPFSKLFEMFLPRKVSQLLAVSVSTMIGTLPFLASFYSNFNFLALFANFVAVPFFSVVFVLLLAFTLVSTILPFMNFLLVIVDGGFYVLNFIAKFYSNNILSIPLTPLYEPISLGIFFLCLLISDFVMLKIKVKAICAGVMACLITIFAVLSLVPHTSREEEIYFLNSFSSSPIVYLKSEEGKSLLIDFEGNLKTSTFLDFVRYKNIDCHLSFKKPSQGYEEFLKGRGTKLSLCFEPSAKIEANSFVRKGKTNTTYNCEGFKFSLCENEGNILGVKVNFDNINIFFAKSENLSYNDIIKLKTTMERVDLLLLEDNLQYLQAIECEKSIAVVANKKTDYFYSGFGDLKITKGETITVRSIG